MLLIFYVFGSTKIGVSSLQTLLRIHQPTVHQQVASIESEGICSDPLLRGVDCESASDVQAHQCELLSFT